MRPDSPEGRSFPQILLLAFVDSEFDDTTTLALQTTVSALREARNWTIAPPEYLDTMEAGYRTVGAQLPVFSPVSPSGDELPVELDRSNRDDARELVQALAAVSNAHGIDIGFELGGTPVGWIVGGQPDELLAVGLFEEWGSRLRSRGG